jgi:hypothetical protein
MVDFCFVNSATIYNELNCTKKTRMTDFDLKVDMVEEFITKENI